WYLTHQPPRFRRARRMTPCRLASLIGHRRQTPGRRPPPDRPQQRPPPHRLPRVRARSCRRAYVLQDLELTTLLALLHLRLRDERLPLQLGEVKSRRLVGHLEADALEKLPQGTQARGVEVVEDRY